MTKYAALDVSMEQTAICVVDESGTKIAEGKVPTDPDAIAGWLVGKAGELVRIGMETGPLAVWLWNELTERGLPILCLDARHANAALSMMPNKTDRHDAAGLAQIVRTGWFKEVRIKSHAAYVVRALLSSRDLLVGIRGKIENEIRGLLKTFGIMFGKKVGGFARRAEEIISGELAAAPEIKAIVETMMEARRSIIERIKFLDVRVRAAAKQNAMARLFMTAPGVGAVIALSVASAYDDASRFRRSSSAGAYLGLTPRRYESGEVSRNGRISKRGDKLTRTHLYEAANVIPDATGWLFLPESLGSANRQGGRLQEGEGRCGAQARRHPPRHVEDEEAVPPHHHHCRSLRSICGRQPQPSSRDASCRDAARMRSLPGMRSTGTANTTSTHPFQREHAAIIAIDPGENPEPGKRCINDQKGPG